MIILNTFSVILQLTFGVAVSLLCLNILKNFYSVTKMASAVAPALFVNHGGGPLPLLGAKDSKEITVFLRDEVKKIVNFKEIKAIILVTAHWEEDVIKISSSEHHDLYFDYYGFPPESYKYRYDAPGDPSLAKKIQDLLIENGFEAKLDPNRGWDHGVFVPMMLIRPEADIPIVQVSVLRSQDPEKHFRYGEILSQFRKEGVAIFGSGMSYHNMRSFFNQGIQGLVNEEFDQYLEKVCLSDRESRRAGFKAWREQKGATEAHPIQAAEHLMPLLVVAGAGGDGKAERVLNFDYKGKFKLGAFLWKDL